MVCSCVITESRLFARRRLFLTGFTDTSCLESFHVPDETAKRTDRGRCFRIVLMFDVWDALCVSFVLCRLVDAAALASPLSAASTAGTVTR